MIQAVSLFSGCGGADLGLLGGFDFLGKHYERNNLKILHASDFDTKAVATYNLNFQRLAEVKDVRLLSLEGVETDLLVGGFPCQSFSSVNPTKDPTDGRSQLFNDMLRLVVQTRPRVVVAENVKGFYRLHKGAYFDDFTSKLESVGYRVFHRVLMAADYGVPQLRQRLFVVGVRSDLDGEFTFPPPTHGPEAKDPLPHVPLKRVIDSLADVPEKYYFSEKAVEGVKRAKPNMKRALAQDLDKPCLTITSHLAKVSLNSRDPVLLVNPEFEKYRRFTPNEAARIQSFPDSFKFAGSEGDAYRQIGNAIPPVLMWHVLKSIEDFLSVS